MPRCLDASQNHKLINHTWADCQDMFLKSTVFLWEGWGQGEGRVSTYECSWETWDVACDKTVPSFSCLKLLQLGLVDDHLAAQSVLTQRSVLVTFPMAETKYWWKNSTGEAFAFLMVPEFQSALEGEDMEEFPVEESCGWGLLPSHHQMGNRTEVGIAFKGPLLVTSTS